jgi:hypothetical protein
MYDLTYRELRISIQYEVGEGLAISSKQTDEIVDQLHHVVMIKKSPRARLFYNPKYCSIIPKVKRKRFFSLF